MFETWREKVLKSMSLLMKGTLFEDISELIPVNNRFLKPISENSKIPLAAKQEKLVTLRKCLVESSGEFYLHLQTFDEKPSGGDDGSSGNNLVEIIWRKICQIALKTENQNGRVG